MSQMRILRNLKFIKKSVSITLIFVFFLNLFINAVFAAGNLSATDLLINTASLNAFVNPGDSFKVEIKGINNGTLDLSNLYGNIYFSDNSNVSFLGNTWTIINDFSIGKNTVDIADWSASNGLYTSISSTLTDALNPDSSTTVSPTASNNFSISQNITTYNNTIYGNFTATDTANNTINSNIFSRTLYVNVRPHITSYYFEKTDGITTTNQIQGSNSEAINLVVKVKDYNGCTNIDGGVVTANLSNLGLSASEVLTYMSCEADGKTAVFKKNSLTTIADIGTYSFSNTSFGATDENGNVNTPNDPNTTFDNEDSTATLALSVIANTTPRLTVITEGDYFIGGPTETSSTLSFSGNYDGSLKVAIGSDGSCNGGTIPPGLDWTAGYLSGTVVSKTIPASSLVEGDNNVYICLENGSGSIGSFYKTITLDTVNPVTSAPSTSPGSVTTNDSSLGFSCSENGFYAVEVGGNGTLGTGTGSTGLLSTTALTTNTYAVPNHYLIAGTNILYAYCKDNAGNISYKTGSILKTIPPVSLSGAISSFIDNDIDFDGLDGYDISLTWDNSGVVGSNFESYRIYVLPSNITLNTSTQTYVTLLTDPTLTSFTGNATLTKDSTNTSFVSGGNYKACIVIIGTDSSYGTPGCSSISVLTADTVAHPIITSAKFTSDTNLELTTNATLDTATGSFSGGLITYQIGATTFTGISIASINTTKLNVTIPAIGNLAAIGGTLTVQTGAIRANAGGYNNYFSSGSLVIADGQSPTVTGFSTGTVSAYGGFYSGSIIINYTFAESMLGGGNTSIRFNRIGGNADNSSPRIYNITTASYLTTGTKNVTVDLSSLGLVSGAFYSINLIGKDLAGNSVTSNTLSSIKFDNIGPEAPNLTALTLLSTLKPTFNWLAPLDDSGNGSGIKRYNLFVYNGLSCTNTALRTPTTTALSYTLGTALPTNNADYSWNISATDNMGNIGTIASCDDFHIDTSLPTITLQKITDVTLGSVSYTKSTDSVQVTATIANTNSGHIWADLSSLAGSGAYNNVLCSDPGTANITCSYIGGVVTYSFVVGFAGTVSNGTRQVQFHAQNTSGGNDLTAITSITADNVSPVITGNPITTPAIGTIWGGTTQDIIWTASSITDNIGIASVKIEYSTGTHSVWNLISTTTNAGTYSWDISALSSRSDYQIRITITDEVGNSVTTNSSVFTIDKIAPTVPSNTITTPNGGEYLRGGQSIDIAWLAGNIVDAGGLAANPIGLEYSINGGSGWVSIATALPNTGIYNWTIPGNINTAQAKIRLTVTDSVSNTTNDISDTNFVIDSTVPILTVSYAGGGGATPQNGAKINFTGIDITASASDTYLSGASYTFQNIANSQYWNGGSWVGSQSWNSLACTGISCSFSQTITPTGITNDTTYRLILRTLDLAGNITLSNPVDYTGDIINPNLSVSTASGTYLSGSLSITGTASDTGSTISSVNLEIKNGSQWWNGTDWVASQQFLVASTSNNYANWSYDFAPLADIDAQSYIITVTAHDSAFKTNNSTSSTITVIKDISGPVINAGIFTTVISGIQKDGNILNITWNTGAILSTGAIVDQNSVVLKFNNGAGIITVTGATANDGSYNYTLPTGDTQNAFFTIEASDVLGNISNLVSSSSFALDSTPPTITTVETREDTLGQINGINIYFSEYINHSSIHLGDFSIAEVANMQTGSISDIGTGTVFAINFTSTGTTATTPSVIYTAGTLTDLSGKPLANVTKTSVDTAPPRIISADISDTNSNGKVDRIIAHASEPLAANTNTSSWTIGNPLAGVSLSSVSVSGSTAILTLTEPTVSDTSTGGMTLSFINNGSWKDSVNNSAIDTLAPLSLVDKAPPVETSAITLDSNGNGKIDGILLTFSEITTGALGSHFSVTGLSAGSAFANSITTSGNTITLHLTETSNSTDTGVTPSFSYIGTSVKDGNNNIMANIASVPVSDKVAPKLVSRTTLDTNGNGYIDTLQLTFSEDISGTGGIAVAVEGGNYSVNSYTLCGTNLLCVGVAEKAAYDGDQTPTVQITANTTLSDSSLNQVASEGSASVSIDGVGPIIIGARYDAGATGGVSDDVIFLVFSESLSGATINSADATADFVINGGGFLTGATVTNISGNTAEIHLGASSVALTAGTSQISIKTGEISDILSNASPTEGANNRVTVTANIVINEVMFATTVANQYIELHNLGSASTSLSGWTIQNAGGITLPAGASIPANGFYLIANSASASSILSGTPDFITASLNLSPTTQSNLVLKDSQSVTFDSAKASPWSAGSGAINIAMERVVYPGDGLSGANWYSAVASVGFDTTIPKGTPGSANIFDATAPVISSVNIADNTLFPLGNVSLVYNYSDNIAMAPTSAIFVLEKWTLASWSGVTAGNISSSGVTASQANYTTNTLPYGKYRTSFSISDTAGNTTTQLTIFYVDQFEFTISTGSINIGTLSPGNLVFAPTDVIITIKTVGAGFNLALGGSGVMNAGTAQMAAWSGTLNKGYGFDWSESGSGTVKALDGSLTAISPTSIGTYALSPDMNGNLKTYVYTVKFGSKIDGLQVAALYQSLPSFGVTLQY